MRITCVSVEGRRRFGAVVDDRVELFEPEICSRTVFRSSVAELNLSRQRSGEVLPLEGTSLRAPVPKPSKIVCVGLNYRDHADESGMELPKEPLLFAKFPSSIIGPGEPIAWPPSLSQEVDWEAELAVVIGSKMIATSPGDSLRGVFGYTVANDISARDLQVSDGQWVRAKSLETFCPIGPYIVTADEFGDPQAKRISARVNGVSMQDASTADMIFPVGELLSWISGQISLEPGDLVMTGTPPGVGAFRIPPVFLNAGDTVEVEVEGIGVLRNPIAGAGGSHER